MEIKCWGKIIEKYLKPVDKIYNDINQAHLSVELVCSSAGQSAAFPPTADPCQMCVGVGGAPEGTHSPTAAKIKTLFYYVKKLHLVHTELHTQSQRDLN